MMRLRLALAVFGSLLLHALLLGLLPLIGGNWLADSQLPIPSPTSRLQVRMLPQASAAIAPETPSSPITDTQLLAKPELNAPNVAIDAARAKPALSARAVTPQSQSTTAQAPIGNASHSDAARAVGDAHASGADTPRPTSPLNLAIPVMPTPPRTALQNLIEKQATRLDPMAKTFEWVAKNTPPVTTEITTTRDSAGNPATKVRTPWSTYCVGSNMAQGATLYELKSYSGNCP